jgi:hypothetical protein
MSGITEAELRDLRQKYHAAHDAYSSCVKALTEAEVRGERPSPELLQDEAKALHELNQARVAYRDALSLMSAM